MRSKSLRAFAPLLLFSAAAFAQPAQLLGDLDALQASTLSKDELQQLLPGATMSRMTNQGTTRQTWSNDPDGSFVVSSDNRHIIGGRPSTAPGKWHISDDGRYCVLIEWKRYPTEEWCRFLIKTTDGHYSVRSLKTPTEKVYKLEISGS